MLPNFLVIGAMSAGTTSLYRYLSEHPQVFMSRRKELYFFVEEANWPKGRTWYERHFDAADGALAVGEACVGYAMHPVFSGVPERIAALLPDVRLIYLVRDPIERMRTQYLRYRFPAKVRAEEPPPGGDPAVAAALNRGWDRRPIERALLESPVYLNTSRYALQIERYLERFPREQLLVVTSEKLRADRESTLGAICRFLGVDDRAPLAASEEFNRTAERRVPRGAVLALQRTPGLRALWRLVPERLKRAGRRGVLGRGVDAGAARIPDTTRRRLEELLRDDVRRLRAYLGDEFDGWGIA